MRYALLSDIHANLHALDAVLAAARRDGVDGYLCSGDLVGYGVYPNECVERVDSLGAGCVAGNHDLIATGRLDDYRSGAAARQSLQWTRGVLRADVRAFLAGLPLRFVAPGLAMTHGSLDDVEEYVRSEERARELLARLPELGRETTLLVLGHTHEPWAVGLRRGTVLRRRTGDILLPAGEPHLVNPGSVGQSRDFNPAARYALLDLERKQVSFRSARYDIRACMEAQRRAGMAPDNCHARPARSEHLRRLMATLPAAVQTPLRAAVGLARGNRKGSA